ncbi:MAG: hypothetical protein ACRD0U_06185, partial [Acidimicrobiales bacterium]
MLVRIPVRRDDPPSHRLIALLLAALGALALVVGGWTGPASSVSAASAAEAYPEDAASGDAVPERHGARAARRSRQA